MKESLDRTAQALGLKTEQPYQPPAMSDRMGEGFSDLQQRLRHTWDAMKPYSFTSEHAAAEEEASAEKGETYSIGGRDYSYSELATELAKVRPYIMSQY